MKVLHTGALTAALFGGAAIGAAMPAVHGQARVAPAREARILDLMGGARIGVSIRDVEPSEVKEGRGGVLVDDVTSDSPAAKAGLQKGDLVVEFDGERVRSARQFRRLVQETPPGRAVQAVVVRDGKRTTVSMTPEAGRGFDFERLEDLARDFAHPVVPQAPPAPPAAPARPAPAPAPPSVWHFDQLPGRSSRLGVSVTALTEQLAEHLGAKHGVLVTSVAEGSAAAAAGLRAGDVITAVNEWAIDSPAELRRRIQNVGNAGEFTLDVVRERKTLSLKGKVEAGEGRSGVRTVI